MKFARSSSLYSHYFETSRLNFLIGQKSGTTLHRERVRARANEGASERAEKGNGRPGESRHLSRNKKRTIVVGEGKKAAMP